MKEIIIFLFILISLIPFFYINKWLQHLVVPGKSLARLVLYFLVMFEMIIVYTFLLVLIISKLFSPS